MAHSWLRHRLLAGTVCVATMGPIAAAPLTVSTLDAAITATLATMSVAAVATLPAHADIPVIDISAITEAVSQFVQMIKDYVVDINNWLADLNSYFTEEEQLATQLKQLATMLDQYLEVVFIGINLIHNPSFTGLLGLISTIGIRLDTLPLNVYSMAGLLSGYRSGAFLSNWQGMPGQVFSLFNANSANDQVYRCNDTSFHCKQSQVRADSASGHKAASLTAYGDLKDHADAVDKLRTQADTATDPKTVADITAQAVAQNAWATLKSAQVEAVNGAAAAHREIEDGQAGQSMQKYAHDYLAAVP